MTSVHEAFDTRIFFKECCSLVAAGFDVTLVAAHNHDEVANGVRIRPLPIHKRRLKRFVLTTLRAFSVARKLDAHLYHFHDPELIPVGMLLKLIGHKVIYDIHEDVPKQIYGKHYIPKFIRLFVALAIRALESGGARLFDAVIVTTPKIAERFTAPNTVVVQNFPSPDELVSSDSIPYRMREPSFAYIGGIAEIRGANEMIRALTGLIDTTAAKLELAGKFGPSALEAKLRSMSGWSVVDYHGQITRRHIARLLGRVRAGLVLYHPLPNHIDAQPIKLFEYMAAGLPVIASDFPHWREIIEGAGAGLLVDPQDTGAISDAMKWILNNPKQAEKMGLNGKRAVLEAYNWKVESHKLIELYHDLI
jgi:glycosyltransferase involved in cell wall biosynthesis